MKLKTIYRLLSLLLLCACMSLVLISCGNDGEGDGGEAAAFRDLTWAVSAPLPRAEDFVKHLPEGCTVRFAETYTFPKLQTYSLELILSSPVGEESRHTVKLHLVRDEEPPVLIGLQDLSVVLGRGISYLSGVRAEDNCDGEVKLEVDTSRVDSSKLGTYPVYYTATDQAGNRTEVRMSVTVYQKEVTLDMLNAEIDDVIKEIITKSMTVEEKARAVYDYVYDNVAYVATSDKSSWVRAAYEGLSTRQGDCYTYFALSKAFFERLGIENIDLKRTQKMSALMDERHFWNLVNIGTEDSPMWYHFDACHIKEQPRPWGCLVTDAQLQEVNAEMEKNGISNYFYAYDTEGIPKTELTVITPVD